MTIETELTGTVQAQEYWNAQTTYSAQINEEGVREELTALNAAENAAKKARNALIAKAQEIANMPKGWIVENVEQKAGKVFITARVTNLNILPPPKEKEIDPYVALRNHHSLIQILNSGTLTKAEKRKIFNLPEIKEGE